MNQKINKIVVIGLSCLAILCTSGAKAMREGTRLEPCYLATVARYLKSKENLKNFKLVSKECGNAVDCLHCNDIPMSFEDAKKFYPKLNTFTIYYKRNGERFGDVNLIDCINDGKILKCGNCDYDSNTVINLLDPSELIVEDIKKVNNRCFEIVCLVPELKYRVIVPLNLLFVEEKAESDFIDMLCSKYPDLSAKAGLKKFAVANLDKPTLDERDFEDCIGVRPASDERPQIGELESVVIPDSMCVAKFTFSHLRSLRTLTVKNNVSLMYRSFAVCESLDNITIGNGCVIGEGSFEDCQNLKTVTIGNDCILEELPFEDCPNLETVIIGKNCKIDVKIFNECKQLSDPKLKVIIDEKELAWDAIGKLTKSRYEKH